MSVYDFQIEDDFDDADDAAIDRWHDGVLDALRFRAIASDDADYMEGYKHGIRDRQVEVVMPARPEGYYHMPLGTF